MTAQPRGISTPGYQPSPSQPIPNRYSQPQFGSAGQAYSPRHVVPSSSPHQPQYYQQPGIASSAHDMYKGPGSVGTGTPPMMMDDSTYRDNNMSLHYYPNPTYVWQSQCPNIRQPSQQAYFRGHMPRGHVPQMAGPREMYYHHGLMPRYSSMPGQTSPAQYQYSNQQPQYHYMAQAPQIPHPQAMYGPAAYSAQYAQQPPPQQQLGPVQAQPMMPQQPPSQKREKRIIRIVDPNTNQDVTEDIIKSQRQDSLSTPPSGRSSATPPAHGDVAAKFAAQVAAAAGTIKNSSPHYSPSVDTQPMMINQNPQLMQQMQQDQQIVGSPSMGVSMVSPNPPYVNMPVPASSPRPPNVPMHSQPLMTAQQYAQHMPPGPATHPAQMLSASGGLVANPPQVQHSQMSMPPPMPDQMPPPVYQLPSQQQTEQFGRPNRVPIRPMTSGIPENVHTYPVARPQQVNVASGEPAVPSSQHLSRPVIQQPPQAVPVIETTAIPQMSKDITQTDSTHVPSQQTDSAPVATPLEVSPSPKEQEPIQSISDDSQNGKSTVEVLPSVPSVQLEGANTTDIAAVSSETSVDAVAIVHTQEALTNTDAERRADARPVEPVPSMPEKTEQTLEKEDTAIRLEDKTVPSIPATEDKPSSDASAKEISEVIPPTTAQKDIDTSTLPTETAGDVKFVSEVAPSLLETEAVKPETSGSSTPVNDIPVKSSKATLQSAEEKAPVPSAKTTVEKLDNKTELAPVQSQTKVQPKADEKQPNKSRVKSPDLSKAPISESKQGKPSRKDSTSSDKQQKPLVSKTPSLQKMTDKPVVNGLDTSTESESGDLAKKAGEGLPSAKITKTGDVKPTVESKSPQPKHEPARSQSVSSEKSSSEKGTESEKTNGLKTARQIKYEGDQWSPLNQEGKRQYDSNFLLQFQYRQTSLEKPKDLPNIDIVLEQPHNKIATPMQPMEIRPGTDFTPPYMRGPGPRRPGGGRQNSRDHGRMGGGRSSMSGSGPRVIQKVVSINRDVELKMTENAWKPSKRDKNPTTKAAGDELSEVIREVRAILNKLTPSTFDALMQQVLALKIDTETKLRSTIDLIFEKAIDEPNFSEAYANMCRKMTTIRVTPDEGTEQTVEFRKLLLTRCQKEFEKNKSDQENLLELKKKMEANTNKEIAPQLKEEYGVAETKERRRTLGNIRFIGELFKLRMLTENIMHGCIMTLFKARDEDHLESLCRLLTTIGKDLDHQKGKQRTNQYFEQIKKIIQEKRTSSRVRFMLQDVFDLRLNNWVPRAVTTQGPKTISQIHQDAKQEQELLQLKLATTSAPAMKQGGRQQNRMGSRGHGEDGWTKVQTPAKPTRFDPTKMKLKTSQFDETKVTLGPSRGYAGWKSGSAGSGLSKTGSGGYSPSASMEKPQETVRSNTPTSMKNRFSALSQGPAQVPDYDNMRRHGGRPSSREGSRTGSRGSMGPPSSGSLGRTPRKDERSSVLEAARKLTSMDRNYEPRQRSSRESSPSIKSPQSSTPRQQQTAHKYNTDLNEEKMQQKSKNILDEFLSIVDFKEAAECIEELNAPPSLMHSLVYIAHEFTLEKKREARINIGRLMAHLLKRGRLSVEQYMKGLAELLEMATDYEIDVPMVWEYFAEQLSPVFEDDNEADTPLSCLAELAAPLRDEEKSGIFVAEVVKAVIKAVTLESFVRRWHKSNMRWSKIFGKSDESVEAFLTQHNLSELSDLRSPPSEQDGGATWRSSADKQYTLERDITKLLDDGLPNEDIFVWVENNILPANVSEPPFLRALTIAVCKKAMDAEGKNVVEDRISERGIVLKKYIDTDPGRELQAVYALQQMMVVLDQPANVLRKFFDVLYNEDVISEQTFYKWEECNDPNEQEGRGVAVASVNPFFTWLRTAEPESD